MKKNKKKKSYSIGMSVGAIFKFKVVDKHDNILKTVGPFWNTVLDGGLDALASGSLKGLTDWCHIGTGSTPVTVGDTDLDTPYTATNNTVSENITSNTTTNIYQGYFREYLFTIGTFSGETIREVGLGSSEVLGTLFNRQILPSPITLASDQGLKVESEVRVYSHLPTTSDEVSGSFDIDGNTITAITRVKTDNAAWTRGSGSDEDIIHRGLANPGKIRLNTDSDGEPGMQSDTVYDNNPSESTGAYVNGTFERTDTLVWDPGDVVGDIRWLGLYWSYDETIGTDYFYPNFVIEFSPTFYLSDLEQLTLYLTYKWGRV